MKHTKNILKSLLITVMALSLLAVSCKKDEGGSKPTDPTPKNSATLLTEMLRGLGQLKGTEQADKDTVMVDFSKMTEPTSGTATIEGANNSKQGSDYKVVTVLKNTFKKANFTGQITLKEDLTTITAPTSSVSTPLSVDITFIANTDKGYTFDDSIINGTAYKYDGSKNPATATLTLKIVPAQPWE